MKLIENIERLGNSMHDAIKNLADEMLGRELSNEEVGDIVDQLKLSDLLILDSAYTAGDKDKVSKILGLEELAEYSMGRNATSAAAERPKPGRREAPQKAATDPAAKNTTQTNRNYSGGAQNAVTTKNINDDDPDAVMQDPEAVEESNVVDMVEWLQSKAGIK